MKKNIAILEIEYHLHFIKTLVDLIDLNKNTITIYTTNNALKDLKVYLGSKLKKVKIKTPKKTLLGFLYNFHKTSNEYDLCFHFSVQTHFLLLPFRYLLFPKCKTILITFRPEIYIGKIFNFHKNPLTLIKEFIFNIIRYMIAKKSSAIITNGLRDIKIIKSRHLQKKVFDIPYAVNCKKYNSLNKKKTVIGIPGSIDPLRRDYFKIIDLIQSLDKLKKKIEIIFIGSFQSNLIKNKKNFKSDYFNNFAMKVDELKKRGFSIRLFKKKLPQKLYNNLIKKSDIIYTHMNFKAYTPSIAQGWTSSYTEAITYNKILLTNRINPPKNIKAIEINYRNDEDFYKKIKFIINNKKKILFNLNKNIYKYFGGKRIAKLLNSEIEKILS